MVFRLTASRLTTPYPFCLAKEICGRVSYFVVFVVMLRGEEEKEEGAVYRYTPWYVCVLSVFVGVRYFSAFLRT